jgi:serine/threonine protein kinase
LLLALGHLHSLGLVYRDLKPENILVDADGHLRITDFGLVKSIGSGNKATTSTFCGSPEYVAPEMLRQTPYTKAVDWWSFGCLVYEMLAGLPPFFDENERRMFYEIQHGELEFPDEISSDAKDLITKLLNRNPNERLGSGPGDYREIQQHRFFAPLNWDDVMNRTITPEWTPYLGEETDVSNFDRQFTTEVPPPNGRESPCHVDPSTQSAFRGFTCEKESRF